MATTFSGVISNAQIGGTGYRPDAQIRASGDNAMIALETTASGIGYESAVCFGEPMSNGVIGHSASISAKYSDNNSTTGYGVLRLNAAYEGQNNSDIGIRIYGGKGMVFWGGGNDQAPSEANKIKMYGTDGSWGFLYVSGGALKFRGQNGTVTTIANS